MLSQNFDFIAALLPIAGCISYAADTFKGETKPNRISWLLWGTAPLIAFAAELVKHTDWRIALITLGASVGPLIVVFATFISRKAYWKLTKFDMLCGLMSVLALVLWAITREGNIAIFFSILADLLACIPTVVKSYTHPQSESAATFVLSVIGAAITLLTIKVWSFANYGFVLYILLASLIIAILILAPRHGKEVAPEHT